MGPARRSPRLADNVVLLRTIAASAESIPRRVAAALGGGADLCLALPESTIQSRLRTTVCHQRGAHLRRDGTPHGAEVGQNLSFQTVLVIFWMGLNVVLRAQLGGTYTEIHEVIPPPGAGRWA